MLIHMLHLPPAAVLCLLEWSLFALYWDFLSRKSSPSKISESVRSRRLHVTLLNTAFLLCVVPVLGSRWEVPLGASGAWVGLFIQSASLILAVWARRHLSSYWSGEVTIKSGHRLIRTGPYRWVRHPIYTAVLGMFLGSSPVSYRGLGGVGFTVACYAYIRKINLEERYLRTEFGSDHEEYRITTGLLLPRIRKIRTAPRGE